MKPVVLIVGGEPSDFAELRANFHVNPYEILHADIPDGACDRLEGRRVDIVIGHDGIAGDGRPDGFAELVEEVTRQSPFARCVLLTEGAPDPAPDQPPLPYRLQARPSRVSELLADIEDWLVDLASLAASQDNDGPPVISLDDGDVVEDLDGLMDQLRSAFERRPTDS